MRGRLRLNFGLGKKAVEGDEGVRLRKELEERTLDLELVRTVGECGADGGKGEEKAWEGTDGVVLDLFRETAKYFDGVSIRM